MDQKKNQNNFKPENFSEVYLNPKIIFAKAPWAKKEVESGRARMLGSFPNEDGFFVLELA